MLLRTISSAAFVLAGFLLFWPLPLEVRVALSGVYFLIGTVAVVGELVLLRLDASGRLP